MKRPCASKWTTGEFGGELKSPVIITGQYGFRISPDHAILSSSENENKFLKIKLTDSVRQI